MGYLAVSVSLSALFWIVGSAQAEPIRIRGEIFKVEGKRIEIASRTGERLSIDLIDPIQVAVTVQSSLSEIKQGDFVGSAAMQQPDGTWRALEVHIFPAGTRNNEGVTSWDLQPKSSMTNGDVAAIDANVTDVRGQALTLNFKGEQRRILVDQGTPVVKTRPGQLGDLRPGVTVFIGSADRQADGTIRASRVTAGTDGVRPPQ
jgi:hypothetical protein